MSSPRQLRDGRLVHFQRRANVDNRIHSKNPTAVGAGSKQPNAFSETFNAVATLTSISNKNKEDKGKSETKKSLRVRFQTE